MKDLMRLLVNGLKLAIRWLKSLTKNNNNVKLLLRLNLGSTLRRAKFNGIYDTPGYVYIGRRTY